MKACIACKHLLVTEESGIGIPGFYESARALCTAQNYPFNIGKYMAEEMIDAASDCGKFEISDAGKAKGWVE